MRKLIGIAIATTLLPLTVLTASAASYSAAPKSMPAQPATTQTPNSTPAPASTPAPVTAPTKAMPVESVASAPLIKAYAATYKVKAKADGELRKKLRYQGNAVKIKSTLKASKMFVDVTIKQTEEGVLTAKGLAAKSLVVDNSRNNGPKTFDFKNGEMGNLSVIYTLRNSLLSDATTLPTINMLRKNKFEKLDFSITSRNEKVSTGLGDLLATKVVATANNGDVLAYYFANNNAQYNGVLVKMTITTKDNEQSLLASLNAYKAR